MNREFVYLDQHVPGMRWDAKYATWDNFVGRPIDGYLANRIIGTRALADALLRARAAAALHGLGILIWDGYRPQRAVDDFVHWSRLPEDGATKHRHYPNLQRSEIFDFGFVATRSGHSRGSTVDLTLYALTTGKVLPMGGDHDLMDFTSHHGAAGIQQEQAANRHRLRSIMEVSGFTAYEAEWWHYTMRDEPYPDTYFDFPIT